MSTENTMSFLDHFGELRIRLLKAVGAIFVCTIISFAITERVIQFLTVPIGGMEQLQSIEMTENISVYMRVSLLSGFIIAFPIVFYQLLAFILPGLTKTEKKWILLSVPFATLLFLSGVAFAYFFMLPAAVPFLVGFLGIPTVPRLSNYINFVTNLIFWIGISFEAPLVVFILAKFKLVSAKTLAKQWRIAIVVIAILAALVTPTVDPINMGLLMLPLTFLYLVSILLAFLA